MPNSSSDASASVRARNLMLIAEHVQTQRITTRAELARVTGLSRTAVSSLVTELLARRVVVECAERPEPGAVGTAAGRPAIGLGLDPSGGVLVGIHLAHDGVQVALADLATTIIDETEHQLDVDHEPADTLEYAASTALELIDRHGLDPRRVLGLGVAIAAPVALSTHALSPTTVLRDWAGIDIAGRLHRRTGIPIHVGNDANLGALAEWRLGAGRGVDDLIYVMLSDGVGAGLVLGGRLYEGGGGGAGELGHVTIQPNGQVCRCGNRGCLETVVGTKSLVSALVNTGAQVDGTDDLVALAEGGNPGAQRVLTDAGRSVGQALAGSCTVLDPRLIIVGGKNARASAPLIQGINDALSRSSSPLNNRSTKVVVGGLGDRAELLGALSIAGSSAVARLLEGPAD